MICLYGVVDQLEGADREMPDFGSDDDILFFGRKPHSTAQD